MAKYDKLRSKPHHQKRLAEQGTGHDVPLADAEELIESAVFKETQPDGRERYKGWLRSKFYRVIVSALPVGQWLIGTIVTAHRDRPPKGK